MCELFVFMDEDPLRLWQRTQQELIYENVTG